MSQAQRLIDGRGEMNIYIKFLDEKDIYAISETYNLNRDELISSLICGRCGDTLYIPVNVDADKNNITIIKPMRERYRPFPKEYPNLVIRGDKEPVTMQVIRNLSHYEQQRLKLFRNMAYVDNKEFDLLIEDFSLNPVEHKCKDLICNEQISGCCQ